MLQSIEIENFRCFEKTSISGFEQINLITGKNNSGKTALLEAMYNFIARNFYENLRRNPSSDKEFQENLFYNQNISHTININGKFIKGEYLLRQPYAEEHEVIVSHHFHYGDTKLEVKLLINEENQFPPANLTSLFDEIEIKGKGELIREGVNIIDSSIEEIRTFATRSQALYLRKVHEKKYIPIFYFGDAIQKIIRYLINILNYQDGEKVYRCLLIDEIENGIHYTAQAEVWRMLMKLCKHYNIQLFATTHSLEMIKAFQSVCSEEEFAGMGGYFELGRSPKSQQIIGVKHDLETLEYELASGDTIRGE